MPGSNGNSSMWDVAPASDSSLTPPSTASVPDTNTTQFNGMNSSGLVGGILSFIFNMIALGHQAAANQQARQDQKMYWDKTNAYNSPANQMKLRAAAGLNPYSQFINGSAQAPGSPVNMAEGMPELYGSLSDTAQKGVENYFQKQALAIAKKQLELTEKKTDKDLLLTDKEIESLKKKNILQDLLNEKEAANEPFYDAWAQLLYDDSYYKTATDMVEWWWSDEYFENRANDVMNSAYLKKQQYLQNEKMFEFQNELMEQKTFVLREINSIKNDSVRALLKTLYFAITEAKIPKP